LKAYFHQHHPSVSFHVIPRAFTAALSCTLSADNDERHLCAPLEPGLGLGRLWALGPAQHITGPAELPPTPCPPSKLLSVAIPLSFDPQVPTRHLYAEPYDLLTIKLLVFHVSHHHDDGLVKDIWNHIINESALLL
jgi:hypothetical protein